MNGSLKKQLLIIYDHQHIRQLLKVILEEQGHTVFTADNIDDALEILSGKKYLHLVLADLMMLSEDRSGFLNIVHSYCKGVRIMAFTYGRYNEQTTRTIGGSDVLVVTIKPYDITELTDILDRMLSEP